MSKKITLENVDSSELPEIPVIGEVKQVRFTQDMELVSTLADSDLFMIQAGADLEARPNTITFDLIIKNLSGPIEEGSKKFVTGDMMFKVIGDMNLLDTWDNTNLVSSLNATYVNVRRIEEELRREINRSTEKDDLHDTQIANLRQDLTSTNEMLNQEINRSVAKDNEHDELLEGLRDDVDSTSAKLDAEIDRSTAKDAEHDTLLKGLRVDVNANKSAIDSEVARSTARDEAHDAAISKNASDIATESSRAKAEEAKIRQEMQAADTNLQNAITAETERATGVEEDLQRQITDLSGSTDDRLEALEALSHEQNTDTGTTSKTFVIDSGNTGAMLKAEGGGLSTRTKGDAGYANFTVQNLVIKGDVTQEGDTFITQAERVEVRDNMILINEGETGAGVTAGFAGIEVDRGTEQNFMFGFNESDGMFKIGKEGNMFDVALRQPVGDMTDGMFASWDAATKTFKTTNLIPPTLQLYLGVPEVSIKYLSSDDGSIKFMTNGNGWSAFTSSKYTNFRSDKNKFQFIGELAVSTGIYDTIDGNFTIRTKGSNVLLLNKSKSVLNSSLTATSFFRSSDNAEVLYSLDQSSLTDGMFLSWDATNKKVVTTNMVKSGSNLYFGIPEVSIRYVGSDGGLLKFMTNNNGWTAFTNSSVTNFRSDANEFQFVGNIQIYNGKLYFTGGTEAIIYLGSSTKLLINNELSTFSTTVKASSFFRSSDDSEVLYQADLKSVLTGKETNYAPTVKAVSDAIDAVNTGTTESLKEYLKLSGGTMTGSIRIVDSGSSSTLQGIYNNDGTRTLLFTYLKGSESRWGVGTKETVGIIRSNVSDLIHLVNNNGTLNEYSIYDKRNLPDPATKSGNNAFTGKNSFVGGKFSVAGSESEVYVSAVGNLVTGSTYGTTGWMRSLEFSDNNVVVARFGVKAITTDNVPTTDFVGILVGDGTVNDSQYKFRTNKLTVPKSWSMIDGENDAITLTSNSSIFGRISTPLYLRGDNTDLFHTKNSTNYKVWDASNLPTPASTSDIPDVSDMARRSEANTFTANNTFTAGQFNVGALEVSSLSSIVVNLSGGGEWARTLSFLMESDTSSQICFGAHSNTTNTDNYAYIGIGDVNESTAQYRFYSNKVLVPETWTLADFNGIGILVIQDTTTSTFGRINGTTYIRGGNTDLYHIKGSTNYKILDESNYSQYLPTTSKWTYGFVTINPRGNKVDFNTVLSGPDSPKILLNYDHELGNDTNAPTDMKYGAVLQIDGNYNSSYNNVVLRPQLAFDVNHNVENGTRYMWFRTANNLGYGDSSNWKRVVTADESVAKISIDGNGYPAIMNINSTNYNWLRTNSEGLLPNTAITLLNGGSSSLGTNGWSFKNAYIANIYSNNIYSGKYFFGTNGAFIDNQSGDSSHIGIGFYTSQREGSPVYVGQLCVSDTYVTSGPNLPHDGIYSKGIIYTSSGIAFNSNAWTNNLVPNRTYGGYLQVLDAYNASSDGGPTNYGTVLQINSRIDHWANQLWFSSLGLYHRHMAYNQTEYSDWQKILTNKDVNIIPTQSTSNPTTLPVNQIFYSEIQRVDGTPTVQGALFSVQGDDEGIQLWADSTRTKLYYRTKWTSYGNWIKLATTSDLGNYLPLSGGTISSSKSNPLTINSTHASQSSIDFSRGGVNKGTVGFYESLGSFLQNVTGETLAVKSDGAYYGTTPNILVKLLTSTDLSGYATQSWVTSQGYLKSHQTIYALTFAAGAFAAKTFTPTSAAATVNIPTKTSHLTNDSGFLTSITKSMVTTALGYTPPTTNTTYSQATSSTLGLVKIGATGLAAKNYAVQLNSSGQMYVAVPWTDTNSTYSAATSSTYGLVKIGATGLASKNYAVQLNSSGQMYVSVPWTDTDTNTHYTTRLYAGASGTAANSATTSPYIKVTDDNTYRNQIRLLGGGATSVSSDASGNITITSTNTTYGLATASSNGLMSSSQYTKLSNCIETVSATNMVTSVQVVDTIPATSSQVTGRLYLKFA